ncbi:MAG: acyl-CoA dehydrogenase family protein [Acidimicrobiia bacterium]
MTIIDSSIAALQIELVERARALAPRLRERAEQAERDRTVPSESIAEILSAGLGGRMLTPARFGGDELTLDAQYEVAVELGRGCASTAWVATLLPHGCHMVGMFPEAGQQAVWADGPDPLIAASLPPAAKVERVNGGYRISGSHPFASGVDHATWVIVSGLVGGESGPVNHQFLVPRKDIRIDDTWFAAGMRATGSKTIVIDNVFVPEGHACAGPTLIAGTAVGGTVNTNLLYRVPLAIHGGLTFIGPVIGAVRGAYEQFVATSRERKTERGQLLAESEVVQEATGTVSAYIDAADALVRRGLHLARTCDPTTAEERAEAIRNYTQAGDFAVDAVDLMLEHSGTRAFMETHPLQRAWRDVHMMTSHIAFTRDNLTHFGRLALGLDPDPKMLIK